MSRTPIIVAGQVYLHTALNEYIVVTAASIGSVRYKGPGINGLSDSLHFIEMTGPVDPEDLTEDEAEVLRAFYPTLAIGWIGPEEEEEEAENEDEEAFSE